LARQQCLAELARRGYATVSESAREVISERVARGLPPRPEPEEFAREIFRRDLEKYNQVKDKAGTVFFDRSAVEALGMVNEARTMPEDLLSSQLEALRFYKTVFLLPPWPEIYRTDNERDHSFGHVGRVHGQVVRWYRRCGYSINEVLCAPIEARAEHVLHYLAAASDA
jgi:predicted ATPase